MLSLVTLFLLAASMCAPALAHMVSGDPTRPRSFCSVPRWIEADALSPLADNVVSSPSAPKVLPGNIRGADS